MTKEEVLQKVNDYCNEKSYTTATLTDAFKDKFADHFQKANADGDINDEAIIASIKFSINTAFSSASDLATVKASEFLSKENDYKKQIEELQKRIKSSSSSDGQQFQLPQEVQAQLDELKEYKNVQLKQEKLKSILRLAKDEIRQDLHASFDKFASDYQVVLDKDEKTQAETLVTKFQDIFKDTIGEIKPLKPKQTQKMDEDFIASIPKVKVS